MKEPANIMDILTPTPPFDPRKKNEAVKFVVPKYVPNLLATKLKV